MRWGFFLQKFHFESAVEDDTHFIPRKLFLSSVETFKTVPKVHIYIICTCTCLYTRVNTWNDKPSESVLPCTVKHGYEKHIFNEITHTEKLLSKFIRHNELRLQQIIIVLPCLFFIALFYYTVKWKIVLLCTYLFFLH